MAKHSYQLKVPTAAGAVTANISLPKAPMRLAEFVPFAQQITTLACKRAIDGLRASGGEVSCKKGCAACCRRCGG